MKKLLVLTLLSLLVFTNVPAQFYNILTPNQRLIYYGDASSYMVDYVGSCVENSFRYHKALYHYTPSEKVSVIMHDLNDYGNAGASTIPRNFVMIAIAPSNFVYETAPANEKN
ncbi:MAG: hypothetical protein H6613_16850 [Ignavibacteriales bacterium]|nr:hypothetical protein [Ignavibacteriales bacterium]